MTTPWGFNPGGASTTSTSPSGATAPTTPGPIEVEGHAVFPSDGLNDTAMTWHTQYLYANGVRLIFTSDNENPYGIRFEGTEGWVFVNRSGIWSQPESLAKSASSPVTSGSTKAATIIGTSWTA